MCAMRGPSVKEGRRLAGGRATRATPAGRPAHRGRSASFVTRASGGDKSAIVVGAGVNGLCTTLRLLESGSYASVKCLASNIVGDPNDGVASGGAGGLWFPYLCESTERTGRWANETREVYEKMLSGGVKFEDSGVAVKPVWQCYSPGDDVPPWAGDCPSFSFVDVAQ